MRPETMKQFEEMREQNIMGIKKVKEQGQKVVGMYCLYSPAELIVAAGAVPVPLCGTKNEPIAAAEKVLPRNLCPLIKSSYGFAATDTCPFFHFSDMLIAETTCDGKKKMYELLSDFKPLHLLQLPQNQDTEAALSYWYEEIEKLKRGLEKELEVTITEDSLRTAVRLLNRERLAKKELQDLAKVKPSPISGMDMLTALFNSGFSADKEASIKLVYQMIEEIKEIIEQKKSPFTGETPRILLTGVPVGLGSHKVVKLIEDCGGNVVCFESCGAYKGVVTSIDEDKDPLLAIAEKYLQTPCSCMSPNTGRFDLVNKLAEEFHVDGVVDLTWQGCHTYNIESYSLKHFLQKNHSLPFLQIETDYSESDVEQLKVRIEAFLEMIGQVF